MERRGGGWGEEEKCRTGRVGSGRNRENYATIGNILAFEKELKGESELKGAEGLDPQPPPHQPHPPPHHDWSTFYSFLSVFKNFIT